MRLSEITTYPVKSCRGHHAESVEVEPWGLAGDRRWMLVDPDGVLITARERPRLLLVVPTVGADGGLRFTAPDAPDLDVPVPRGDGVPVQVFGDALQSIPAGDAAHDWFTALLGRPARLVHLADPTQRPVSPDFARPDDRVSFADGYPLLLTTTASLDALNDLIAAGPRPEEGPLPMARFRPNVVIGGAAPWAEDGWRTLRIGAATFRAPKGCERCVMTTTDPATAARGKEPITTLARHRRWDGKTWFGMNLVPDNPGVRISVGDEVEILDAVADPDGPPR